MNNFDKMFLELNSGSFIPDSLKYFDQFLFEKINEQWHNSFFDYIMPFVREPTFWVPFYLFLALLVFFNFGAKGWVWVLFAIALAMISDYTSSTIIKGLFPRLRPCRDPSIAEHIRFIVSYCPMSSSFVSSHAVNHFAISTFIFVTFKNAISPKWAFIFIWAVLICYAQVYVGVHFPLDVTAGAVVGIIIGYLLSALFNRFFPLPVSR